MEKYTSKRNIGDKIYFVDEPVGKSLTHPIREVTITEVIVTERVAKKYERCGDIVIDEYYKGEFFKNGNRQYTYSRHIDFFDKRTEAQVEQKRLREELKKGLEEEQLRKDENLKQNLQSQLDEIRKEADRLGVKLK